MLSRGPDDFPFEAVRDLIGVVRSIYAAARLRGAGRAELDRIAKVGRDLCVAYDLARESGAGTMGSRAAWARAESATRRAGDLVRIIDGAEGIVRAAACRVRGEVSVAIGRTKRNER